MDPPEPSADETIVDPSTVRLPGSANPPASPDHDVLITGSRFIEPGNPIVLARNSAKQEALERQKVRFDVSHYAHLNVSDVLSDYLSHVHSSCDSEIEMVKKLQLKYETALTEFGSQLTDAKTRLADQEAEIKIANSKLQLSLSETEKLKTSLTEKKKSWADEKTLLVQRAEAAEAALEEVTTELTSLKNRVSQMVSVIFGGATVHWGSTGTCYYLPCQSRTQPFE